MTCFKSKMSSPWIWEKFWTSFTNLLGKAFVPLFPKFANILPLIKDRVNTLMWGKKICFKICNCADVKFTGLIVIYPDQMGNGHYRTDIKKIFLMRWWELNLMNFFGRSWPELTSSLDWHHGKPLEVEKWTIGLSFSGLPLSPFPFHKHLLQRARPQ